MKQKIIWRALFLFGTLSSFISCETEIDRKHYTNYMYTNKTNYKINIDVYNKFWDENSGFRYVKTSYLLLKNEVLFQEFEILFGDKTGIILEADSVTVSYEGLKKAYFSPIENISSFNITNANNYNFNEISEIHKEYSYVFTMLDYENAEDCEGSCE